MPRSTVPVGFGHWRLTRAANANPPPLTAGLLAPPPSILQLVQGTADAPVIRVAPYQPSNLGACLYLTGADGLDLVGQRLADGG